MNARRHRNSVTLHLPRWAAALFLLLLLVLASLAGGSQPPPGVQDWPALVYDGQHNQYLLTYSETDSSNYSQIRGLRLDASGTPIGSAFNISSVAATSRYYPRVSFNAGSDRFLVVWEDYRSGSPGVWGQVVAADGSLVGANISIVALGSNDSHPSVAADPVTGRFLVVWPDNRNNATSMTDIYGRIIASDGTALAADFPISTASAQQTLPAVVYEPGGARFLVAWIDPRVSYGDVYGQLVTADGALYDPDGAGVGTDLTDPTVNFPIFTSATNAAYNVSLAEANGQILAAWSLDDGNIYGRLVSATGTLVGTGAFSITTATGSQNFPVAAGDSVTHRFWVAWRDGRSSDADVYAQEIDASGSLYDRDPGTAPDLTDPTVNLEVFPADSLNQVNPAFAVNPFCGHALVATPISGTPYSMAEILTGACAPAYPLISVDPVNPAGITAGGLAGAPTTFEATWWGAALPTQAELWIDLDHDGVAGGTVTSAWPVDPAGWAAPLVAAGLTVLLLAAMPRRRAVFTALLATALVLSLAAAGLVSCGSGGGGGKHKRQQVQVNERFTLTEVSAADTNASDGKAYGLTVTIGQPGTYAYKYVFSDGSTSAVGSGASGGTMTIQ